jgi:hypothetical protein
MEDEEEREVEGVGVSEGLERLNEIDAVGVRVDRVVEEETVNEDKEIDDDALEEAEPNRECVIVKEKEENVTDEDSERV